MEAPTTLSGDIIYLETSVWGNALRPQALWDTGGRTWANFGEPKLSAGCGFQFMFMYMFELHAS